MAKLLAKMFSLLFREWVLAMYYKKKNTAKLIRFHSCFDD